MTIVLVEHDPAWSDTFAHEANRIRPAFGAGLVAIHHIGSTAIQGLVAKPVIDILAVVKNVNMLDVRNDAFQTLGYEVMGEFGIPGRRYFRKDDSAGVRTHQVHTYAQESVEDIERHLFFRDYLRGHQNAAREYAQLKQSLAEACNGDMVCYSDGKTAFIRDVERRRGTTENVSDVNCQRIDDQSAAVPNSFS